MSLANVGQFPIHTCHYSAEVGGTANLWISTQKFNPITDGFAAAQFAPAFQSAYCEGWLRSGGIGGTQHLELWTL